MHSRLHLEDHATYASSRCLHSVTIYTFVCMRHNMATVSVARMPAPYGSTKLHIVDTHSLDLSYKVSQDPTLIVLFNASDDGMLDILQRLSRADDCTSIFCCFRLDPFQPSLNLNCESLICGKTY